MYRVRKTVKYNAWVLKEIPERRSGNRYKRWAGGDEFQDGSRDCYESECPGLPRHDLDDWILRIRMKIDAKWEMSPVKALDVRLPVRQ